MRWPKIDNSIRRQPVEGSWSDWKPEIALDCENCCVYCGLRTSRHGGLDNYHVDHFRPKVPFDTLKLDIRNLYLACGICNRFKSNDWPAEPAVDCSISAHIDPAVHDYNSQYEIDGMFFTVAGKTVAARYVSDRLYLNRSQLIRDRLLDSITLKAKDFNAFVRRAVPWLKTQGSTEARMLLARIAETLAIIQDLQHKIADSQPYTLEEIRRPQKAKSKKPGTTKAATTKKASHRKRS